MNSSTASLDSYNWIQGSNRSLKRLKVAILIWKDTELSIIHTKTYTSVNVLLGRLEPSITLGLQNEYYQSSFECVLCSMLLTCLKMWCSNASYAS